MAPSRFFPDDVIVTNESPVTFPSAKRMRAESGIVKRRATLKRGLSWTRTYSQLFSQDPDVRDLLSFIRLVDNRGYFFRVQHKMLPGSGKEPGGVGTATTADPNRTDTLFTYSPRVLDSDATFSRSSTATYRGGVIVDGTDQSGGTITTRGWPATTSNVVRAGDFIRIEGLGAVREVVSDASSDGNGKADVMVNPPISADESPSDGAVVEASDIYIWCDLANSPSLPQGHNNAFYINDLTLEFQEVPNA